LDEVKQSAPKPQEEKKEQPPIASENKKSIQEIKQDLLTYISENNTEKILNAIDMIEKLQRMIRKCDFLFLSRMKNERGRRKICNGTCIIAIPCGGCACYSRSDAILF